VWRGHDRVTGGVCAIKVLRPELTADPGAVTRFVRERTALVKFRHPNVVTLRDMIVEGDSLALVMDLIDGGDLGGYRRGHGGTLPAADALRLTAQICDALAAAHAAGIVHRDLKPANVLLDDGQVRLADFGIARVVGESPATTTGMIIGTIGFMAPEVIRGEEPTPACDVYAVGITLYELLTGAQPFTGQAVAVMRSHLDAAPVRPDGMPGRLWSLLSACLGKDPAARPTAAVVARALRDPALLAETAAAPPSGAFARSPWAPDGLPSGPVTQGRPSGAFSAPRSGPVTASARFAGAAPGAVAVETAPPVTEAPWGGPAPETEAPWGGPAPETEAAFVGFGTPGQPPGPVQRGDHRGPRRRGIRPVWAVAAALALVLGGIGGTYLVMSGPSGSSAGGPVASQAAVMPSQSTAALSARTAKPTPSPRSSASTAASSAPPSASASAAPADTAGSATTPEGTPASAPVGTPGPTGPNLVADGDFTGSLSEWNEQVLNTVVVSAGSRGGYAAQMSGDPTAGVTQVISGLKPGTEYELTGWIISDTGNYSTYVGVKEYDSSDPAGVSRALNNTTWTEAVLTFTPGAGHTTAEVFCWQAVAGTGYCTDVSVRAMS
jgi:serine/threonine protein kinase, bacterial